MKKTVFVDGVERYKKPIVMHRSKTAFMPMGKVASMSIRHSLEAGHEQTEYVTIPTLADRYGDYTKVAVVRNPFERLVSAYSYFGNSFPRDYIVYSSFGGFLRAVYDTPDEVADCHFRSQVDLLTDEGEFLPDVIVKFKDISRIGEVLPVPDLRHNEGTRSVHDAYQAYYTPELRKLVEKRFADDLSSLGYTFVGDTTPTIHVQTL